MNKRFKKYKFILFFVFLIFLQLFPQLATSQHKVNFNRISLESAKQRAHYEDKPIFIDTYAPWCQPCKLLALEFQDKELSQYLNKHFINVKIDMGSKWGEDIQKYYDVIFLPTILYLDKNGNQKIIIDKLISAAEILAYAKSVVEGPTYTASQRAPEQKQIIKKEIKKKIETQPSNKIKPKDISVDDDEKILFVLDESNKPPELLYEEAYFRMQFMDGTHLKTAKEYLATQDDWSSEKNLRFIFDFLYDTDSDEFKYFITNKEAFKAYYSNFDIAKTVEILVSKKLYQGYPRPDFDKANTLFSYLDEANAKENSYVYYLHNLFQENDFQNFNSVFTEYDNSFDELENEIEYMYCLNQLDQDLNRKETNTCIDRLESMVLKHQDNLDYQTLITEFYIKKGDKSKATKAVMKALETCKTQKADDQKLSELNKTIENL